MQLLQGVGLVNNSEGRPAIGNDSQYMIYIIIDANHATGFYVYFFIARRTL